MDDNVPGSLRIAALADIYAGAHFFVVIGRREWLFHVGETPTDIERQIVAGSYLFITAWNPRSQVLSPEQNQAADERLRQRLAQCGCSAPHSAMACGNDGHATEQGWIATDLSLETADALAREFDQLGTLYWRHGEPVRMRMQSPMPAEFPGHPYIDWVG